MTASTRESRSFRRAPGPITAGRGGAFTLLELMVVIAVLGILTAMIVPSFGGAYRDAALRASARKLAATANLAYSQAVTTGRPHRIRIDAAAGRWWLEARREAPAGDAGTGGERPFERVTRVPGGEGRLEDGVAARVLAPGDGTELAGPRPAGGAAARDFATIDFRPDGTAEGKEVWLEDEGGSSLAVRIHPVTSRVRVVAGEAARAGRRAPP